jgi:hypothetical protein
VFVLTMFECIFSVTYDCCQVSRTLVDNLSLSAKYVTKRVAKEIGARKIGRKICSKCHFMVDFYHVLSLFFLR